LQQAAVDPGIFPTRVIDQTVPVDQVKKILCGYFKQTAILYFSFRQGG
jgi:hypothetical protein